jgi:DNA-binding IclR family transcriptional regulator
MFQQNESAPGSLGTLRENMAMIREFGYALDDEEEESEFDASAPPFRVYSECVAAISIVENTIWIGAEEFPSVSEQVKRTAQAISQQLGCLPRSLGHPPGMPANPG